MSSAVLCFAYVTSDCFLFCSISHEFEWEANHSTVCLTSTLIRIIIKSTTFWLWEGAWSMIIVFARSPLTLQGIQRESSTAAWQIKWYFNNGFFNHYTSILQCAKTWMNGVMTCSTVVWNNDRFECLGLIRHFCASFRPLKCTCCYCAGRHDHKEATSLCCTFCAQGHRGVKGYDEEWLINHTFNVI